MCFNSSYFLGEMHLSATQEDPFPPASYLITAALSTDKWAAAAMRSPDVAGSAFWTSVSAKLAEVGGSRASSHASY